MLFVLTGATMARKPAVADDGQTQRTRRAELDSHRRQPTGQPDSRGVPCDKQQRLRQQ